MVKTSSAANEATLDSNTDADDDRFEYMCTSTEEQAFDLDKSEFVRSDEHRLFSNETYIASSAYMY